MQNSSWDYDGWAAETPKKRDEAPAGRTVRTEQVQETQEQEAAVDALMAAVAQRDIRIAELQEENRQLAKNQLLGGWEPKPAPSEDARSGMEEEISSLKSALQGRDAKIRILEADLREAAEGLRSAEARIAIAVPSQNSEAERKQREAAEQALSECQAQLEAVQQEKQQLQAALEESNERVRMLEKELRGTAEYLEKIEAQIANAARITEGGDAAALRAEIAHLSETNNDQAEENARMISEIAQQSAEIARLSKENRSLTEENTHRVQENQTLSAENSRLTEENARLTEEHDRLAEDNRSLTARTEKYRAELRLQRRSGDGSKTGEDDRVLVKRFNEILARASMDVSAAKRDAIAQMEERTTDFADRWQNAEAAMNQMLTQFRENSLAMCESYEASCRAAAASLRAYEQQVSRMMRSAEEIAQTRLEMQNAMRSAIDEVSCADAEEEE